MKLKVLMKANLFWLSMVKSILFSSVLILLVLAADRGWLFFPDRFPDFFTMQISLARMILAALAGALLTITTFTFTTILTVLNLYASGFTPRVLENFIQKKITMNILGIYVGGFLYCIVSLAATRGADPDRLVVSGFVAVLYSVMCILYFVFFAFEVTRSIQMDHVVSELAAEALASIENAVGERKKLEETEKRRDEAAPEKPLESGEAGYLEAIDFAGILSAFGEEDGVLVIHKRIGDHVTEGDCLGGLQGGAAPGPEEMEKLRSFFLIQSAKIVGSDYHFGITKLVEVGIRALSPGINDPNTAIRCLEEIGLLLGRISAAGANRPSVRSKGRFEIHYRDFDLQYELQSTYEQFLQYGKEDLSVVRAIFKSLQLVYDRSLPENRETVNFFEQYVFDKIAPYYDHPVEKSELAKLRLGKGTPRKAPEQQEETA